MSNQKLVAIDDARLQTLAVEVKALTIGKKQMTLAVFRQLPDDALIDLDDPQFKLNGLPWGRVNYHWSGCYVPPPSQNMSSEHIHVVWQRGGTLAQAAISIDLPVHHFYVQFGIDLLGFSSDRTIWPRFEAAMTLLQLLYTTRVTELLALDQLFIAV